MNELLKNFEAFWESKCKDTLTENKVVDFLLYVYYHLGEGKDDKGSK